MNITPSVSVSMNFTNVSFKKYSKEGHTLSILDKEQAFMSSGSSAEFTFSIDYEVFDSQNTTRGHGDAWLSINNILFFKKLQVINATPSFRVDLLSLSLPQFHISSLDPYSKEIYYMLKDNFDSPDLKEVFQVAVTAALTDNLDLIYNRTGLIDPVLKYCYPPSSSKKCFGLNMIRTNYTFFPNYTIDYFDGKVVNDSATYVQRISQEVINIVKYGGYQMMLTSNLIKNVLKFAIDMKLIDSELNYQNWPIGFSFLAGDIANAIPSILQTFKPNARSEGLCSASRLVDFQVNSFYALLKLIKLLGLPWLK